MQGRRTLTSAFRLPVHAAIKKGSRPNARMMFRQKTALVRIACVKVLLYRTACNYQTFVRRQPAWVIASGSFEVTMVTLPGNSRSVRKTIVDASSAVAMRSLLFNLG
jgi:hypothetical protein